MNKPQVHYLKRIVSIFCVFLIVHLAALLVPGFFRWADTRVNNLFFHLRHFFQGAQPDSPHLILFTLDDQFEKNYNTPAGERAKIAEALDNIRASGTRTILLDIIFRERDNTPDSDERLVQATQSSGNIFYPFNVNRNTLPGYPIPEFISAKALWPLKITRQGRPVKVTPGITPFPELCRAARGLGGITFFPESDGVIHRVPLVYSCEGKFIPSLVLAGICDYFRAAPGTVSLAFGKHILLPGAVSPGGGVKDIQIPVDNKGQMLVNFTGPWRESVTSYSLENILSPHAETNIPKITFPAAEPANLVLIGDITTAAKDISQGIFDANYPMVGIIHNSLNTILTGKYLYQPAAREQIIISLLLLALIFLTGFLRKDPIRPGWLLFVYSIYAAIIFILFMTNGRLPDISLSFLAFACSGLLIFLQEMQEIKQLMLTDDALEVPPVPGRQPVAAEPVMADGTPAEKQPADTGSLQALGLNPAQTEIIMLLIKGLQYKEIGYSLHISATAAGRRINRIYHKLGVNNKVELINIYRQSGGSAHHD